MCSSDLFFWTIFNLLPRAISHHKWYKEKFEDYPKEGKIIKKIGLGFSFQKVSSLPIEKHDIKLDFIVTEKNTYR